MYIYSLIRKQNVRFLQKLSKNDNVTIIDTRDQMKTWRFFFSQENTTYHLCED